MDNSILKTRILTEVEKIISGSSAKGKMTRKIQDFHEAIIKKHYNAADVKIDYHRRRIKMDIVMDDEAYNPKKPNINLKTLHMNLIFENIHAFLKSCIEKDTKSLAFYAKLIQGFSNTTTAKLISY